MKKILFPIFLFITQFCFAQHTTLSGHVVDEKGNALEYVSAALLHPNDSTLAFFGISGSNGSFLIKDVTNGKYLLQLSFVGYQTQFFPLEIPDAKGNDLGDFSLQPKVNLLDNVEVKAERVPLQLKGDTVEYNANAYKTQPDASAEDLLKKLPGVEVDQSGNIKAQGENVNQVLVDGKEFFSSDPKVATKNLPADAVDKVQVFDKKSDEADFTGIDDGSRSKTINLLLKDNKKSAWLGDVQAGYGTDNHYETNAKIYRFTKTDQFAALGMLNNINEFGFSFNDYIDFNGGIQSLMSGGGGFRIQEGGDDDLPLNFGQQITGLITSGAGGLNFTHEAKPGNRINVSYLGNGYDKHLVQNMLTQNFTPDFSFNTDEDLDQITKNLSNRINFNFRNKPDSMQSIFADGNLALVAGKQNANSFTQTFSADSLTNALTSETYDHSNAVKGTASLNYIHKGRSSWKVFKANADVSAKSTLTETEWNNLTQFFNPTDSISDNQYQHDHNHQLDLSGGFSASKKIKDTYYFEPNVNLGGTNEVLNREQGFPNVEDSKIDSLSPDFSRNNQWVQSALAFKHSTQKTQWRISLGAEAISLQNNLNGDHAQQNSFLYFTPQFFIEKEIRQGRNFHIYYNSQVNAPQASQLLPSTNYADPLHLFTGNRNLKPEYNHNLQFNYVLFDQFSFTSLFTHLRLGYTKDKINYSKTINPDLSESLTLVNVPNDYTASLGADFSTPIRPVRLNFNVGLNEDYNRGINYVNADENIINSFTHQLNVSFDNRKKDKIDLSFGGKIELSNAIYSVESSQSNHYFNWSYFTEIHYTPEQHWRFSFNADVNHYGVQGFNQNTIVPLLKAEVVHYILKSNRGVISLEGYDLLNKNSGITQTGEYNYLQRTESNTIGRYFLLSFKYRLNKFDNGNGGVDVKVNGR